MRITDVEVIPLRIPQHNVHIADGIQDDVIVRVHTDEGISGVCEADSSPMVVKAIVEAWPSWPRCRGLKDILVGEDPFDVEMLWEKMRFGTLWLGRNGVAQQAIAAVDIALRTVIGISPCPVMNTMGMRTSALSSSVWKSRPLTPGSRTSSTRQLGTSGRSLCRNSCGEANASARNCTD